MKNIQQAVDILKAGELVAFPTETVYGLGADARNEAALQKIFLAKGRPTDHPLIVHLADVSELSAWADTISEDAKRLAHAFWPGPLTLILTKKAGVSDRVTGGQGTIGLRVPYHPVAHALLKAFGSGLAAPSANRFGRISPTSAEAVREELGEKVSLVLDGGACEIGLESTIVDVSGESPIILRPGGITAHHIETVLNKPLLRGKKNAPRVSGSHASHYAPETHTLLLPRDKILSFLKDQKNRIALLCFPDFPSLFDPEIVRVSMPSNPIDYAHDLYRTLRELDKKAFKYIVIEVVPLLESWDAVRDRLTRAALS